MSNPTSSEPALEPKYWKDLFSRFKALDDILSAKTLAVILNGVEELAKARTANSSIRVSSIHLSTFRSLSESFNNPRLLKQIGMLYLHEFGLPEVAMEHFELALQLSSGQKDQQIEALRDAAVARISRTMPRDIHATVDQPIRLKPVVSTVVRKTGQLTLNGAVSRLTLSIKTSLAADTEKLIDPASPLAKAGALLQQNQWREALPCLDAGRAAHAPTLVLQKLYTQAGLMALAGGDLDHALEACIKARDAHATKADAWINVGVVYQQSGRLNEALASFTRAQELDPTNPEVWCNLSSAQFERGDFAEAEKAARHALQLSTKHAQAWDALAAALAATDRLPEAAEACAQAIELKPDLSSSWFKKGTIEFQQDNLGKARDAFTRAQAHPEFLPFVLYYLAMINARQGNFEEAQGKLNDARAQAPTSDLLLIVLREMALNFTQRNNLTQALKFYQEALALQPDDFASWLGIGTVHHREGRYGDARRAYLQASKLQSDHPGPWHNLGLLAAEQLCHAEEQACFEKVVHLSPQNPKAWYALGVSLQSQGKEAESQQAFAQAESLIGEPMGATGDLLTGLKMVRRVHLKKRVVQVK